MAKQFTEDDDALLSELGVEVESKKVVAHTPHEERVISGFEEIQRFFEEHDRAPQHGEDKDIFERIYAVRLDRLRELSDFHALLKPLDHQQLLKATEKLATLDDDYMDDDALLAELGVEAETAEISELRHVRSSAEKRLPKRLPTVKVVKTLIASSHCSSGFRMNLIRV